MKTHFILLICLSILSACGGSDSSTTAEITTTTTSNTLTLAVVESYQLQSNTDALAQVSGRLDNLSIEEFYLQSYLTLVERKPESIIANGTTAEFMGLPIELNNISDQYYFQENEIKKLILSKLQSYNRDMLTKAELLSYDIYQAYLELEIEAAEYKDFEYPATYGLFGWPTNTESYFTQRAPLNDLTDANNYLLLLNQLGRRFEQIEALLDTRESAGIIEPAITLNYSKEGVENIANTSVTNTSFYQAFNEKVSLLTNITSTEKNDLDELLKQTIEQRVLPAYQQLAQKMTALAQKAPNNIGFGQFSGGKEFYDFTLHYYTSGNFTAEEIHQLGIDELARIHTEMRTFFDQLGYPQNESIAQLYARVETDGGIIEGNNAVEYYEEIISQAYAKLPEVFSTLPQQEVVVIGGDSGGYYIRGSDDGTRPGAFYAYTAGDLPYTTMPTLAYHEAVPGHHLQIALAKELDLPLFRREIGFTSFIEGWALYAERLAKDLGWYNGDVYGDLGRLQFEAMRAARLVLDTGIHSKSWTFQQAEQFSTDNVGNRGSIARYSVLPGQATAYMIGMLKIIELRDRAKGQLGDNYDVREFHSTVIGSGAMPLDILDNMINQYITNKLP
ncbi:MAG: DUF885 domain-containing protein [Colwellia sp.]|nr:DUF885 domain-containing protein [Colwellia sp.]